MPAFYRATVANFSSASPDQVSGVLSEALIKAFPGDHSRQLSSWKMQVELLQAALSNLSNMEASANKWVLMFEYPLLRLQRRLDVVLLAGSVILVIEFKVGASSYQAGDLQQAENYALDLQDFHAGSRECCIIPVLCATAAPDLPIEPISLANGVTTAVRTNSTTLSQLLCDLAKRPQSHQIDGDAWDRAAYQPVPTIIRAAELLFAGHEVREVAHAGSEPENLTRTTDRLIEIIVNARAHGNRVVAFITGVPGSGKTLVGLNATHDARFSEQGLGRGAFLSGNTPLVTVLREALAKDDSRRTGKTLKNARREVRTKIQGLMNFLREYLDAHTDGAPDEHVVVFDEAQRAWDAKYGATKFDRLASEPELFLEIMERQPDWAVIVALVGGGQEINRGERGLQEWGAALRARNESLSERLWTVLAAPQALSGGEATAWQSIFDNARVPAWAEPDSHLHLGVSVRSYRCIEITRWVDELLKGNIEAARGVALQSSDFPIFITRSLAEARTWLRQHIRGFRRAGLVATSGARRLRAEGLGVSLSASELSDVANWYLCPEGDIRSSNALEVTANEYTCQGLELDYVGLCWDGDLIRQSSANEWMPRQMKGSKWQKVGDADMSRWILNKYRVLLTRSRLGMVIWVPAGEAKDPTRLPATFDAIAAALIQSGVRPL